MHKPLQCKIHEKERLEYYCNTCDVSCGLDWLFKVLLIYILIFIFICRYQSAANVLKACINILYTIVSF